MLCKGKKETKKRKMNRFKKRHKIKEVNKGRALTKMRRRKPIEKRNIKG